MDLTRSFASGDAGTQVYKPSKGSWHREPGFGLPPGRGLSMTLLCSKYLWSVGVMEYWKNENPTPIFCNLKQRASVTLNRGHRNSLMHRVHG
jgi:hypothetical protein